MTMESLEVVLGFQKGIFLLTIKNVGTEPVYLWEKTWLYGYHLFSFRLRKDKDRKFLVINRKLIRWTINVPDYFELKPDQSRQMELDINDGSWDSSDISEYRNAAQIYVSIEMHIEENEYTEKYNILTGKVVSNEILFQSISDLIVGENSK